MNKTKMLLIAICALIAIAAFSFTTMYVDTEEIQSKYLATINGSYIQKYVKLKDTVTTGENGEDNTQQTGGSVAAPNDTNAAAWEAWVKGAKGSETRKAILLEGIDCLNKGVIYHQLNAGSKSPSSCIAPAQCDGSYYPGAPAYDFKTQAAHNILDPLYLDCSMFVKHCYSIAGYECTSRSTNQFKDAADFTTIPFEEVTPGDIAVKKGHIVIYLGTTSDGQTMFVEMADHDFDMEIKVRNVDQMLANGYVFRRYGALANDTEFVGGTGVNAGGQESAGTHQIKWDDTWQFAHTEMKHPESLNKYVPANFNGHTVFLNPGHGDGSALASTVPKDPVSDLANQYNGSANAGHTGGTAYKTSSGKQVSEAQYVLDVANAAKDKLLEKGYAVIMARESLVNNFENSARSVWANNSADIHVAIHIDAKTYGPGWYRPSAKMAAHPNYSKHAAQSEKLGTSIENALETTLGMEKFTNRNGVLTGYSYSTIPTAYIELYGVQSKEMADFADTHIQEAAQGIVDGIDVYFK